MKNIADLEELKAATELILINACKGPDKVVPGAINWGDLHCIDVEEYSMLSGEHGVRVYIEEASPDTWELERYVSNQLELIGYPGIEVRCNW